MKKIVLALCAIGAIWLVTIWFQRQNIPLEPTRVSRMRPKPTESDGDVNYRNMRWLAFLMPEVQRTSPEAVKVYADVEKLAKSRKYNEAIKLAETIRPIDKSRDQEIYMKAILWTAEGIARAGDVEGGLQITKKIPEPGLSFGLHKMAQVAADKGHFQQAREIIEQIKLDNIKHLAFQSLRTRQAWLETPDQWCKRLIAQPESKEVIGWLKSGKNTLGEMWTNIGSIRFAENIYKQGASKVYAIGIDINPGFENAGDLVIELPTEPDKRKKVFVWAGKQARSLGFDPDLDEGQQYLFVALD